MCAPSARTAAGAVAAGAIASWSRSWRCGLKVVTEMQKYFPFPCALHGKKLKILQNMFLSLKVYQIIILEEGDELSSTHASQQTG